MQFKKYLSFPAVLALNNTVEEETTYGVWFLGNLSCLPADRHISSVHGGVYLPLKLFCIVPPL